MRKSKKITVKLVLLYLIMTVGIWMFLYSYTNSYNRLTDEKIAPAVLTVSEKSAELKVIGKSFCMDFDIIAPESKVYFMLYLICPAELRAELIALFMY